MRLFGSPRTKVNLLIIGAIIALAVIGLLWGVDGRSGSEESTHGEPAGLVSDACNHIALEATLYSKLLQQPNAGMSDDLRANLAGNERQFQDLATRIGNALPQDRMAVDGLVEGFGRLTAVGRDADAASRENARATALNMLDDRLVPLANHLREDCGVIEHSLLRHRDF